MGSIQFCDQRGYFLELHEFHEFQDGNQSFHTEQMLLFLYKPELLRSILTVRLVEAAAQLWRYSGVFCAISAQTTISDEIIFVSCADAEY